MKPEIDRDGGPADRGQTLHDYLVGISVFVVTVGIVLGLLPTVVAPFQDGTGAVDGRLSTGIGDRVVSNFSVAGKPNVLEGEAVSSLLAKDQQSLRNRYGLSSDQYVNLSLRTLNGSVTVSNATGAVQSAGATAQGEDTVTATRIVQVTDPGFDCRPACKLVVSVW